MKEDRKAKYIQKVSDSIFDVMEYLKYSEMGGEIDTTDPWYPTYVSMRDLLVKVDDEEDMQDREDLADQMAFYENEGN